MGGAVRSYGYVGPEDVRAAVRGHAVGAVIRTGEELGRWLGSQGAGELEEPFTYVVGLDGFLRLAPRRSEHVACAGGGRVLGAGEVGFERLGAGWGVREVSNQSTGYCPDVTSWSAVAGALGRAGLVVPEGFTYEVVFRRCEACGERAIVREGDFVCVFCGAELPAEWNLDG